MHDSQPVAAEQDAPVEQQEDAGGQPGLTMQEVKERWETVKSRIKQKNKQTAPMLNYFTIVGVEAAEGETVVLIEAANDTFFKMLSQGDRAKHVDWALSLEFGQPCRVRLLRTGERPVSAPPVQKPAPAARPKSHSNTGDQATAPKPTTQAKSAEPATEPAPAKPKPVTDGTNGRKNNPSASSAQATSSAQQRLAPLARSNVVRENSNTVSAAAAQEMLEQKAKSNPVVQEVMRTFTVKNIQVNPK